jgi:hypothetical protein
MTDKIELKCFTNKNDSITVFGESGCLVFTSEDDEHLVEIVLRASDVVRLRAFLGKWIAGCREMTEAHSSLMADALESIVGKED